MLAARMFTALDHVVIAVRDLDAAAQSYARLLGRAPSWRGVHPGAGTSNVLFRLENSYLELLAGTRPGRGAARARLCDRRREGGGGAAASSRNRGERARRRRGAGVGERSGAPLAQHRSCRRRRRAACCCSRSSTSRPPTPCRSRSPRRPPKPRPRARSRGGGERRSRGRPPALRRGARPAPRAGSALRGARSAHPVLPRRRRDASRWRGPSSRRPRRPPPIASAGSPTGSPTSPRRARGWPRTAFDVSPVRPGAKPGTLVCSVRAGTASVPTLLVGPAGPATDEPVS